MSNQSGPDNDIKTRLFQDADYKPVLSNWYAARPYGFQFTDRSGKSTIMFLPISPSNLTVSTNFATNIVSTLYGTVEEHSPVRYYDIAIEGTTGMAPKYVDPVDKGTFQPGNEGRANFPIKQSLDRSTAGFFSKTLNTAQNIYDQTANLLNGPPSAPTGVTLEETGYLAFHNLYRFLLAYKKDASGEGDRKRVKRPVVNGDDVHPLVFFNYKDNVQYKVVVRGFTLKRSAEDPMLYNYSIVLRGYDLTTADNNVEPHLEEDMISQLGLDGVDASSFLTKAKDISSTAKSILSSVGSGVNQLGR
jgi:hypothetical protein